MFNHAVCLDSLNLSSYNLIDGPVFIKDKLGRYLWVNFPQPEQLQLLVL